MEECGNEKLGGKIFKILPCFSKNTSEVEKFVQPTGDAMAIQTLTIQERGRTIKVHAIQTGTVQVKRSHRSLRFPAALRFPSILLSPFWTNPLPIYCWVIEHPEGIILIDTGENARVTDKGYFDCDPVNGPINRRILKFDVQTEQEIVPQLARIGIQPDQVRWLVLTHLHLDHVDGISAFSHSEILLSQAEWQRPYGAVQCLLPSWFGSQVKLVSHTDSKHPIFSGAHRLTEAGDVILVPTPGHTHGHQSVLLRLEGMNICFAGDLAFDEQQLLNQQLAGICIDLKAARDTHHRVLKLIQAEPTIFLPSHDPESGMRLVKRQLTQS